MDVIKDIIDYIKEFPISTALILGLMAYIMYHHQYYRNFEDQHRNTRGMRNNLMDGRITNPTQPRSSHPSVSGQRPGTVKRALIDQVIRDESSGYSNRVRKAQNHQLMGLSLHNQITTMIVPQHNVL